MHSLPSFADDPLIGEVKMFAGNFAPRGWALCEGQLLSIASNTALFSILGTTYGGDGRTTFALPDLRGRSAIGPGRGPGLSDYRLGQRTGAEVNTLNVLQLPSHSHVATFTQTSGETTIPATDDEANLDDPTDAVLAIPNIGGSNQLYSKSTPNTQLSKGTATVTGTVTIGHAGGNQSFNNRPPELAINYIIALTGIFPSRS